MGLKEWKAKKTGGVSSRFGVGQTNQHGTVASGEEDAGIVVVFHLALCVDDGG